MEEQFCTYEICLKLKELGFNEYCISYYNSDDQIEPYESFRKYVNSDFQDVNSCCAVLWQQAIQWIFEKYSVIVDIHPIVVSGSGKRNIYFSFEIFETINEKIMFDETDSGYKTLNEARTVAILKSFKLCTNE